MAACIVCGVFVGSAAAQGSTAPRGTTKVHARLYNPFDVSGSEISVDRFGIVTYRGGSARSAPSVTPYWASAAAFTALSTPAASASTAAVVAASSVATVSVTPTTGSLAAPAAGADLAVGSSVRPPYRPPVRSPFRPPPRPPFIP